MTDSKLNNLSHKEIFSEFYWMKNENMTENTLDHIKDVELTLSETCLNTFSSYFLFLK